MKIDRKKLSDALKAVSPGVSSSDTIQQSSSFVFDDGRVYTYNDEISVSAPIELGFTGSVSAKEFLNLVNKFSTKEITVTADGNELLVTSGKSNAGLRMEDEIKLPLEELGKPKNWVKLPEEFNDAVSSCLFSVGKDATKYVLTHIHVNGSDVESCDSYRATRYYMSEKAAKAFPEPILIPATAAKNLVSYKPEEYCGTDGWLHFKNEYDVIFSFRWPEGEVFPDISTFIDMKGDKIQLPDSLSESMDRGAVLSEGNRLSILLDSTGTLVLATENETGWFEEETPIDYKGKTLEFDTYPEFLTKILKIKAEVTVDEKLMKFETEDFTHIVALLPPLKKGK